MTSVKMRIWDYAVLSRVGIEATEHVPVEGYLSKRALLLGFRRAVEITDTKNDSSTVAKFFQTKITQVIMVI